MTVRLCEVHIDCFLIDLKDAYSIPQVWNADFLLLKP